MILHDDLGGLTGGRLGVSDGEKSHDGSLVEGLSHVGLSAGRIQLHWFHGLIVEPMGGGLILISGKPVLVCYC